MKLEDPELSALVDAYREAQRPADARRKRMRTRLGRATVQRPAWQVYGMTAALAAAALLVIWLGARLVGGERQRRTDTTMPAQAPHDALRQRDSGNASSRKASAPAADSTHRASSTMQADTGPALPPPKRIEPRPTPQPSEPSPSPVARTTGSQVRDDAAEDEPSDEVALIVRAEAALRADQPERALRLLQLHERRHPGASTSEERLALRILALCALGRVEEGRGLRHSFLRQFTGSAYRSRIERACPR